MAHYNRWQNQSLYGAADGLDATARQSDRGAFFGSIQATLSHILWGDSVWMSRFDNWESPEINIPNSVNFAPDWEAQKAARITADQRFLDWSIRVTSDDLDGDLTWYSGSLASDVTKSRSLCIVHMFNHQTHHRGQVHAMLTAAGAKPNDSDLFIMPDSV